MLFLPFLLALVPIVGAPCFTCTLWAPFCELKDLKTQEVSLIKGFGVVSGRLLKLRGYVCP